MLEDVVCYIEHLDEEERCRAASILGLLKKRYISEEDAERRLRSVLDDIGNALLTIYLESCSSS